MIRRMLFPNNHWKTGRANYCLTNLTLYGEDYRLRLRYSNGLQIYHTRGLMIFKSLEINVLKSSSLIMNGGII